MSDPPGTDPWGNPLPSGTDPWGNPTTPAPAPGGPQRFEGTAIGSLVCAVIGLACAGVILEPVAIVLGIRARKKIAASQGTLKGENLAMIGIITGIIGMILAIISIVTLIRNPHLLDNLVPTTTTAGA